MIRDGTKEAKRTRARTWLDQVLRVYNNLIEAIY